MESNALHCPAEDDTEVRVFCVEAGTLVGRDDVGNDLIVTETVAVNIGKTWWVAPPAFEVIRQVTEQRAYKVKNLS